MILITGANGSLGKATIDYLVKEGVNPKEINALVRDTAKGKDLESKGITLKIGDYNNYDSLISAFKNIDKLLLISGTDLENRGKQHENIVRAAKEAGVKHILYTSFERNNETETSPISFVAGAHIFTENIIKESGMAYTIFRNNLYMDMLPMFWGEHIKDKGIFFPAGETKAAFTLRDDMAEAIAKVISSNSNDNNEYYISNLEIVSLPEIAVILSEITNSKITYHNPSVEQYKEMAKRSGIPDMYVQVIAGFGEAIRQGEFLPAKSDLKNLIGRTPTTVKQFLKAIYSNG